MPASVLGHISNRKSDYALELLNKCCLKLKKRNNLIGIVDSSDAGWDTVKFYESNPVASDSDDESKINKAENRALRKRKQLVTKKIEKKGISSIFINGVSFASPFLNSKPPVDLPL